MRAQNKDAIGAMYSCMHVSTKKVERRRSLNGKKNKSRSWARLDLSIQPPSYVRESTQQLPVVSSV